ncbi:unnamed protein product [Symbiodinium natans]|uniref:Uncharacterized protein n=1 Tax=Symbiodinium natans TaxID=878477 RepID=A0A812GBG1_9DINO|nr:unnamed protein product [Symbiodinium natans]
MDCGEKIAEDTIAVIGNASFPDFDLDRGDLGGVFSWEPPADTSKVTHYVVYMARYHDNESQDCYEDVVQLSASVTGSFSFSVPATPEQVEAAARQAVLAALPGIDPNNLFVVVAKAIRITHSKTITADCHFAVPRAAKEYFSTVTAQTNASGSEDGGDDEPSPNVSRRLSSYDFSDAPEDSDAIPRQLSASVGLFSLSLSWCRKFVASTLEGSTTITVPPETALANWTHYLVYASSSLAEQSYPRALLIDLDFHDLGGRLSWDPPNSTERLAAYAVYLAESSSGGSRSQLGFELAPDVLFYDVPPKLGDTSISLKNTPRDNFTHFTVFTKSVLVEQTTPAFLAIQDEASRANNVSFIDDDLDLGEIGGNLSWLAAVDDSEVVEYAIYLAEGRDGTNRSLLGNVSRDVFSFLVPDNTELLSSWALSSYTHLLVYGRSPLEEQTTPSSVVIIETIASVANVSFTDLDLDAGELGGTVSFLPPASAERVVSYVAYLSTGFGDSMSDRTCEEAVGILPDTALANFTHVLIYTKSRLAEQSTPVAISLQDNNASASTVLFADLDLDLGDIGGPLLWRAPADTSLVTHYEVYLTNDTMAQWREHYATLPVGTTNLQIRAEKRLMTESTYLSHFLVYTRSELVEQSTPSMHQIVDEFASVSNISFTDLDLDLDEIGGLVSWDAAAKTDLVEGYNLYVADSPDGSFRSQVEDGVNVTTLEILYDTPRQNFSHLVVYTRSALVEQTTPVSAALLDSSATVSNVTFTDYDLDATDIAGPLEWAPPSDISEVATYVVYLARSAPVFGGARVCSQRLESMQATSAQTEEADHEFLLSGKIPADSEGASWALIAGAFTVNAEGGAEAAALATRLALAQLLDVDEVTTAVGGRRLAAGRSLAANDWQISFQAVVPQTSLRSSLALLRGLATDASNFEAWTAHFLYAAGIERAIAASIGISDMTIAEAPLSAWLGVAEQNVSDIHAASLGPAIGGTLLAICERSYVGNVSIGTNLLDVPEESALQAFTHLLVYTVSSEGVEQSTPMATRILDVTSSISNLAFVDKDLDEDELGGDIYWQAPSDSRRVLGYRAYLSAGLLAGQSRSLIGSEVTVGTNQTFLPAETLLDTWTHIAVFTRSQLVEQTTPAGGSISDTSASVSAIDFPDNDLDEFEVGGLLSWSDPIDFSEVTHYEVYFAEDRSGTNRSYLGNVSVGINSFDVPPDTPLRSFSHLVVYARSELAEQTTPAAVRIIESVASVSAVNFIDLDLDEKELGGDLLWQPPPSPDRVEFYVVYLAIDAAGGEVPVGVHQTTLPADAKQDTSLSNFAHFARQHLREMSLCFEKPANQVYTRSALAEQSTPVGVALSDSTAFVSNLTFPDLDLDITELGGNLTWVPPVDDRLVNLARNYSQRCFIEDLQGFKRLGYNVFFADDPACQDAACQKLLVENVWANDTLVIISPDTPILNFTHLLIYATSGFAEQTTPASLEIVDANASVSNIRFVDKDLESKELGGDVLWTAPDGFIDRVEAYVLYLSATGAGDQRISLGSEVAVGTDVRSIPPETATGGRDFLSIFTRSSLVEQTTPVALEFSDAVSVVENVSFPDFDLDASDLGGVLAWSEPRDISQAANRASLEITMVRKSAVC